MYHHDNRDYQEAASEAAKRGKEKLQGVIDAGIKKAESVVETVMGRVIADRVVKAPFCELRVFPDGAKSLAAGGQGNPIHPHAYGQLLTDVGLPKKYADHVEQEAGGLLWGKHLVAHNVNTILNSRTKQRNLVRTEGGPDGVVKGWLSDKFRRLDSRPLLDSFIGACRELNLVPIDGVASETKCRLRAVLPVVFEPIDTEVMVFGAEFGNSDYGDGGVVVNLWTMRVWCTNLAVTEKCLRQVHLGGRLPDDVQFSDHTYQLDAQTTAAAIRDTVGSVVGPDRIHRMLDAIKAAGDKELSKVDGVDKALGRVLDKGELAQVKGFYEGEDVVNLPPGNTLWRLSNAVSWFAQHKSVNADRKLELQQVAGQLVAPDREKSALSV